ncbi:MAG: sodium:proton exchanger, partial [Elusimicrobia bacterium CG11_big_fil_rev_8_21_14_0_20_64_6]
MNPGLFILLLGFVIYAGVVGSWVYEKRHIPDVLILIVIGLIMGPVLKLVPAGALSPWMPYVGSIALSLILFEGGLDLDFNHIVTRIASAFLMATGSFLLSLSFIAL